MSSIISRGEQMFPVLTEAQQAVARTFASGRAHGFARGEIISAIGARNAPVWLVLDGSIHIVRRDGLGHEKPVTTLTAGQFTGEVSQLAGRASIAEGAAGPHGCTAVPFDAAHLRALLIGSAEISEIVMRAFILRRANLIEDSASGSVLVGRADELHLRRIQGLLTRNGYPNTVLDADGDEGRALIDRLGVAEADLPLMVCPNGAILKRPSDLEAAICLGLTPELDPAVVYDVAIVGAGPAGLATAVYAASEGLSVIIIDQGAIGGQAGASARIENYLGFPTGISGHALASRAYNQALKFGAELAVPMQVARMVCPEGPGGHEPIRLELTSGEVLQTRAVVIASGARYRRPDIANLGEFEGTGISYWATPVEARLCAGETVALVGAGNSAGQAVAFLASKAAKLHLLVRGKSLDASMSRYLIDRIAALPNVEVHLRTEITALAGNAATGLQGAVCRNRDTGDIRSFDLRHLFLFIGADPNAGWAGDCVETDERGFVITGTGPMPLQTNQPGVFAIGDVRAGSTKRVAAAVGEGAAVVSQIHRHLAALAKRPRDAAA